MALTPGLATLGCVVFILMAVGAKLLDVVGVIGATKAAWNLVVTMEASALDSTLLTGRHRLKR